MRKCISKTTIDVCRGIVAVSWDASYCDHGSGDALVMTMSYGDAAPWSDEGRCISQIYRWNLGKT